MRVHIVIDSVLKNTVTIESMEAAERLFPDAIVLDADTHKGGKGDTWNGWQFEKPVSSPKPRIIRDYEFRNRFTVDEQKYVISLAFGGDQLAQYLMFRMQTASDGVDLELPIVKDGLDYLVSLGGAITEETKARVLA